MITFKVKLGQFKDTRIDVFSLGKKGFALLPSLLLEI